jgi:hypothetical protein
MYNNGYALKERSGPRQIYRQDRVRMTETKVFINNDNLTILVCPECGKVTEVDVSGYSSINQAVRISHLCECGYAHTLFLERRKFRRKKVELSGICVFGENKSKRRMTVRDLSRAGLKIELKIKEDMKVGDKIFVVFRLDNEEQTTVRKEVIIRNIIENLNGLSLGGEFYPREFGSDFDKILGLYTFH